MPTPNFAFHYTDKTSHPKYQQPGHSHMKTVSPHSHQPAVPSNNANPPPVTPPPATSMSGHSNELNDIEQFLTSISKNDGYKSPYERKREKDIKKLGKRLNSMAEQKMMKEEELDLMKQDMVLQSLRMEEDSMM